MNQEHKLILELLKYDVNVHDDFFLNNVNWINILGYLTYHRVAGLTYEKMEKIGVRKFDYPVYFTTYMINELQKERTLEQNKWINIISNELDKNNIEYVFLKGSILNNTLFKYGSRASNDIDILIKKDSIPVVTNILHNLGFIQGKYDYKNKKIIKFTQEELDKSILTRGETAPFVRKNNNPAVETIDVDLNFSIDWSQNNNEIVDYFLKNRISIIKNDNIPIYSLNYYHNFIELCIHLYKDSSLVGILKKRKVLDLYKFIDIYYFIKKYFTEIDIDILYQEIKKYSLEKYIYFSLTYTTELFPDSKSNQIESLLRKIKTENILNIIFEQEDENKKMITSSTITERIFSYDVIHKYRRIYNETDHK